MILCYLVWMILSILDEICKGVGYEFLYFSMDNGYIVSVEYD